MQAAQTKHSVREYESVISELHSREALCVLHDLEWFNPRTRRGAMRSRGRGPETSHRDQSSGGRPRRDTRSRGRRPYSEASRDQSSGGNGKQRDPTHLISPVQISSREHHARPWLWLL